jgi:NRAMP (natural resistance-associated macrophage protein)-like metal ion transporter
VERYGKGWVRVIILFFIQGSVFGDDIQACVGATIALQIMTGLPWWAACLLTIVVSLMLTLAYHWDAYKLELFIGTLLLAMLVLVCVNAGQGNASARAVLYGWVVPQVGNGQVLTVVGSVGGVLTPSALFLGSALVLNRPVNRSSSRDVRQAVLYSTLELMLGMVGAFFILFAITITFANGFYRSDCAAQNQAWVPSEGQCDSIGLGDGPDALYNLYGVAAKYVFAITLLFSGISSMVSATLGGQATWEGLCRTKLAFWKVVLVTRSIVLVPTLALAITKGNDDVTYTIINDWVNIYMSLAMPIAAIPLIDIAASKQFMKSMAIHPLRLAVSILCVLALIGINFYLMAEFLFDPDTFGSVGDFPTTSNFYAGVGAIWLFYSYFLLQVARPGLEDLAVWFWHLLPFASCHST